MTPEDVEVIKTEERDLFDDLVSAAKDAKDTGFIVPDGENEPLLQVSKYIEMDAPFQELIGAPGIPCGLITEVYGHPDSGKTTFCTEILKKTQEQGGVPILLLTELKYDLPRAAAMGLNVKRMLIRRPRTIESVREHIHDVVSYIARVKSDKPITIVWDSLGSTPCEKELNEKRGDFAADQAAAITVLLRKTQAIIRDHNIAFVMINQISTRIGISFGKKTQAKGGFAPKFYSALRIEFSKTGRVRAHGEKEGDFVGIKTAIEVEKNHLGQPFKTLDAEIDFKGFVFGRRVERAPKKLKKKEDEPSGEVSKATKKRATGELKA